MAYGGVFESLKVFRVIRFLRLLKLIKIFTGQERLMVWIAEQGLVLWVRPRPAARPGSGGVAPRAAEHALRTR